MKIALSLVNFQFELDASSLLRRAALAWKVAKGILRGDELAVHLAEDCCECPATVLFMWEDASEAPHPLYREQAMRAATRILTPGDGGPEGGGEGGGGAGDVGPN